MYINKSNNVILINAKVSITKSAMQQIGLLKTHMIFICTFDCFDSILWSIFFRTPIQLLQLIQPSSHNDRFSVNSVKQAVLTE